MRKRVCLMCLVLPLIAQADAAKENPKAYRWTDRDGTVHFSSSPPPSGIKATEIELRQPDAVIHQENRDQLLEQSRKVGEKADARQEERLQLMQQIDDAKAALAQANEAFTKGEAPLPGELQHLAGGGTRLSESYRQRREAESKRIEQIEQQIDNLYGKLNKLR